MSKRSVTTLQTNAPDAELIRQAREHLANADPAIATLHAVTPEFESRPCTGTCPRASATA